MKIIKNIASLVLLALAVMSISGPSTKNVHKHRFENHAFFAGTYDQTHVYGCSNDYSFEGFGSSNYEEVVKFSIETREVEQVNATSEGLVQSGNVFAPDFDDYEFKDFNPSSYQSFDEPFNSDFRGPKRPYDNSVCKIRAYYHDVQGPNGLMTVMIDSTGFVVGESLVMSTAHGFYRDVTVDFFDDGIDNPVFPGDIEIYGAIGLGDEWGEDYVYFSKATEIFVKHDYVSDFFESDDWCLLRTDNPLGKELTISRLICLNGLFPRNDSTMLGYPMWNQWCQMVSVANVSQEGQGLLYYDCASFPGMSGAPIKNRDDPFVAVVCSGEFCATERAVFAMHTSFDGAGTGRAIPVNGFMVRLVDSLNEHYRPNVLTFLPLNASTIGHLMSRDSIGFREMGSCAVQSSNCGEGSRKISLGLPNSTARSAFLDMEFELPVSSVDFQFSSGSIPSDAVVRLEIETWTGGLSNTDLVVNGRSHVSLVSNYTVRSPVVGEMIKRLRFLMMRSGRYSFGIEPISVVVGWHYRPTNGSELVFGDDFVNWGERHNCVSYALNIESIFEDEVRHAETDYPYFGYCPGFHRGHVLSHNSYEFSPGNIISALKDDLHADNIDFIRIGKFDVCPPGMYKVAIVFDPYHYFHLLRQNSDGTWSHYFRGMEAYKYDSNETTIFDPEDMVMMSNVHRFGVTSFVSGGNNLTEAFDITSFGGYYAVDNGLKVNVHEH